MFLLNQYGKQGKFAEKIFTIQNVSIKFHLYLCLNVLRNHLQYKMFLLNEVGEFIHELKPKIYNTKCFY